MPINSLPNQEQNLEDIFADAGTEPSTLPLVETVPYEEARPVSTRPRRRSVILIASVVGCLLLLSGAGVGLFFWITSTARPHTQPVVNQPAVVNPVNTVNTPTNAVVNTPTTTTTTFVDNDHDGLSDQEELQLNTNPKKKDTDEDGLSDREEAKVYLTDPRNTDTDGDGYADGTEVAHFYDPASSDPKKRLFQLPQN